MKKIIKISKKKPLIEQNSPEFKNYKKVLVQYKSRMHESTTPNKDALCYAIKKKMKSLDNDIIVLLVITQHVNGDKVDKKERDELLYKAGYTKGDGTTLQQGAYSKFKEELKWQGLLIKQFEPIMKDLNTQFNTKVAWV